MVNRRTALGALASAGCVPWSAFSAQAGSARLIEGVVWQPSGNSVAPRGTWQRLGARNLLVQWSAVDGLAYLPGTRLPGAPRMPDWGEIGRQPWASEVVLGMAGIFDGHAARKGAVDLGSQSAEVARVWTEMGRTAKPPLRVSGWYFPVEVDTTWAEVKSLVPLFARLPRPLWISAYDNANIGAREYADWLAGWLPGDVGVFFQDGVGIHTREPGVAVQYDQAIAARLGRQRTRLIAEAFRVQGLNRFGSATATELLAQLNTYKGRPVYLFEGPQYVEDALVAEIVERCVKGAAC